MIGNVGGKIGVTAVRLLEWPVDVVAEVGRAEQRLLAIFPILKIASLRRWQPAFVDLAALAQTLDSRANFVALAFDQGSFGEKHIEMDIECGKIVADDVHHHGDRLGAYDGQPFGLLHRAQLRAVLGGEFASDRLEIVAGIKAFGNCADIFTERLAVTQESRARQHIHLRARIVDVVFARDVEAGEQEQIGKRVAEHRAAAVADMHGSGRIGRDVLDIDFFAFADVTAVRNPRPARAPGAVLRSRHSALARD